MKLSFIVLTTTLLPGAFLSAQTPADGEKVTVAGCLQRAQRSGSLGGTVVGTSASPNTADDEANSSAIVDAFILAEATPAIGGTPQSPGTSGNSTPAAGATGTAGRLQMTSYGLVGREAELERHQGGRLEITGTIAPAATSGRGTGGAATAAGTKRIKVESFKVLADTCATR
jgi:hypothetical protein